MNGHPTSGTLPDTDFRSLLTPENSAPGAFPDLCYGVEDEIAEGDRVIVHLRAQGTHRGELMGVPPAGGRITFDEYGSGNTSCGSTRTSVAILRTAIRQIP